MNKCLVTELKAHTNNEALSKYNVLTIKVKGAEIDNIFARVFSIGAGNGKVSIKSDNIGFLVTSTGQDIEPYPIVVAENSYFTRHIEKKDGVIEVNGKYNINSFRVTDAFIVRARELYGIPDGCIVEELCIENTEEGEIDASLLMKKVDKAKIKKLACSGHSVSVINKNPASVISSLTNLTSNESSEAFFNNASLDDYRDCVNLTVIAHSGYTIPGNLSSLSKMTKLEYIHFDGKKQVSGDFRPLIQAWIDNGRTEGKINVTWLLTQANITLDGSRITYPIGVPANSAYLNWTSDGTVTFTAN